ncbi:hypothetical protein MMC11_002765 [Xylographa trunciseda]|nr:hypothetical protein [Xylographa trunciseda]
MATDKTYPIEGIPLPKPPPPDGSVPLRREVNEWFRSKVDKDVIQVKLFLLALLDFEEMEVEQQLSYFQVAGIHGYPQKDWDGVPKPKMDPKSENLEGYCTHNSVLFPSWHRPYIMLYEQRLYELMEGVITKYTAGAPTQTKSAWRDAADSWRLPYWDWATQTTTRFPAIAREPDIEIDTPAYPSKSYRNPMYKFVMPKLEKMGDHGVPEVSGVPYENCIGTSRWTKATTGSKWVDGEVDNDAVEKALTDAAWPQKGMPSMTIADAVYRLFTEDWFKKYEAFATTHLYKLEKDKDVTHYLSLEGIHNMIHNWTGGVKLEGHMSEVPVAAFDPIFWLHHANIDRFYAMWQDLYPDLWWNDSSPLAGDGVPRTFLKPSQDNSTSGEWTSDKARYWRDVCRHSYPELQPWLPKYQKDEKDKEIDWERYRLDILATINKLYGTTRALTLFALGGAPFTIHVLLGPTSQTITEPATYSNEIGIIYNFSSTLHIEGGNVGCANCAAQAAQGALATGLLPLTSALIELSADENSGLDLQDNAQTENWLKENLTWKVTTVGGEEVDLSHFHSLTVTVARGTGMHSRQDAVLSTFTSYELLPAVTDSQDRGLRLGQHL